jgi:hypothetical protein
LIKFLFAYVDEKQREEGFNAVLRPILIRSSSVISENKLTESIKEQSPSSKIDDGEIMHLKPSQLPLMNQVNITIHTLNMRMK